MAMRAILGGSPASFTGLAVLFVLAAAMTGQALARNWRPVWQVVPYALLLGAGDRFLLFALFDGALLIGDRLCADRRAAAAGRWRRLSADAGVAYGHAVSVAL